MQLKNYKHLGCVIDSNLHRELFKAMRKQSKILGRKIGVAEIIAPYLHQYITATKNDSQ